MNLFNAFFRFIPLCKRGCCLFGPVITSPRSLFRASSFAKMISVLLLLFFSTLVWASDISLNTADVIVANRSQATLNKALPEAFEQVLIKMSGNTAVMTLPAIQAVSTKVDQWVESYRYAQSTGAGQPQLLLHVAFDKAGLKQLLRDAHQPIWGAQRPLTLVWVVAPEGPETALLTENDGSEVAQALRARAALRGMPVVFPTSEALDQSVLDAEPSIPSDERLAALAEQYHVHSLLAGVVRVDGAGAEQVQWRWILNGNPVDWGVDADGAVQAMREGVDKTADMMANQLATISNLHAETDIVLQISGVQDLNDYVHIVSALRHLNPVSQVHVANMENNTLLLNVRLSGQKSALVSALSSVKRLAAEPEESNAVNLGVHADLYYHWVSNAPRDVAGSQLTQTSASSDHFDTDGFSL